MLQILIYKFAIAKFELSEYEYCISIQNISSIQTIDTSMFTSIHLRLYKCTFTEQGLRMLI